MKSRVSVLALSSCLLLSAAPPSWIAAQKSGSGFVLTTSGTAFIPWGFNYDRDEQFHLIEDYWDTDWPRVERDVREMKRLGANVVRVNLQFAKFMDAPGKPNQANLARLSRLVEFAGELGIYLDITGLGTNRIQDVPAWYRNASEKAHWSAQAEFWEAVARVCADRPGVFAYNLMNEPIATATSRPAGEWVHPSEIDGLHYLEFINLTPAGRKPPEIARAWLHQMTESIRKLDQRHLITVGSVWIDIGPAEKAAGFPPSIIAPDVDFFAVHAYPERGKVSAALDTLARYKVGKPILIEETFPLKCDITEFRAFLERSRGIANGWLGFYWGDLKSATDVKSMLMRGWLDLFQAMNPNH